MKGFTLVEMLIVLGIFSVMAAAVAPFTYDNYESTLFLSEKSSLVSLLQQARQQSIDNIDGMPHGVHFDNDEVTVFEGGTYASSSSQSGEVDLSKTVTLAGGVDVVFEQLSGQSSVSMSLQLIDGRRSASIIVEASGRIDY
jgi:prepilin-type N-terminal cleavage/methylation domain-containing protein